MNKITSHKEAVIERFSRQALNYERHARLQKNIALKLAASFPELERPDVLEIGCGTGLLTKHLLSSYSSGHFLISDLSKAMLNQCEKVCGRQHNIQYVVMDGEKTGLEKRFDLIATSMTVQWFDTPQKSLAQLRSRLKPGGHLLFSTVGPNLFPQWRSILQELGLPCGLVDIPDIPGQYAEEFHEMHFENGMQFLDNLRYTGASHPRQGYHGLTPGSLRRAIRLFESKMACRADWHILYGHLRG